MPLGTSAIVGAVASTVNGVVDRLLPDANKAAELKVAMIEAISAIEATNIKQAAEIIQAEAQSQSWLTRSWRPILMLWFGGLVGAYWLGFTAPNLTEATVLELLGIVKWGIGGYVVGRSGEQIAKTAAKAYAQR